MKYVVAFRPSDGGAPLEDGCTRESVSAECRVAALAFMSGVASGWEKRDLAQWLVGPYARAVRHGQLLRIPSPSEPPAPIPRANVEALLTHVRGQMIAMLETAALQLCRLEDPRALAFAREARRRGLVRDAIDAAGETAWIPVDATLMCLRDRMRSLFAADYLNAAADYADLFVCHRCEAVVFDAAAKRLGTCGAHRLSGFVTRGSDSPETPAERILEARSSQR